MNDNYYNSRSSCPIKSSSNSDNSIIISIGRNSDIIGSGGSSYLNFNIAVSVGGSEFKITTHPFI